MCLYYYGNGVVEGCGVVWIGGELLFGELGGLIVLVGFGVIGY